MPPSPDACRACFPDRSLTDFKLRDLHIGAALDLVDHFIAPSRFLRDRFIACRFPADRITVIPNGLPAVDPRPHAAIMRATASRSSATSTASKAQMSR